VLRWLSTIILSLCVGWGGIARADDGADVCRQFIEVKRDEAISVIKAADKNFTAKHEALTSLFEKTVDIDWLAQKSAGEYWRKANENDRKAYEKVYRAYLTDYYVGALDESDLAGIKDITLTKFKAVDGNVAHARIKISQKDDEPSEVDMHLVEEPKGVCHIRDFTVEGISMVASQSEEIQSLGKIGGLKLITEKLASHHQTR
jgi:ABC-type transporter MlaC component